MKARHPGRFVLFLMGHSLLSVRADNHVTLPGSFGMLTLSLFPLETQCEKLSHVERLHVGAEGPAELGPGAKHMNEDVSFF